MFRQRFTGLQVVRELLFGVDVCDAHLTVRASIDDLQGNARVVRIVEARDIEIGFVITGGAALECAQETIRAVDREVIGALTIRSKSPLIGDLRVGLHGVGPGPLRGRL